MSLANTADHEKIEAYFAEAAEFAQPICEKLRVAIAAADPELTACWKWGGPVYEKAGAGLVCAIGVFKKHVNFVFFQGALLPDPHGLFPNDQNAKNMRSMKFTQASQVNEPLIINYLQEAVKLPKQTAPKTTAREEITIPDDLKQTLTQALQLEKFEKLAYTHRKEYVRWVNEAKRTETRENRITKTVERITEGKKFS